MNVLPNGIGESTGDILVTGKPLFMSGRVWWVNSAYTYDMDGDEAMGTNRDQPFTSLVSAYGSCADGDIIVLQDGHSETIDETLLITKSVTIVGAGSNSGVPTAELIPDLSSTNMLDIDVNEGTGVVELRNIKIGANVQTNNDARIMLTKINLFKMSGCYIECDQYDRGYALDSVLEGGVVIFENNTWISIAEDINHRPKAPLKMPSVPAIVNGDVYDNGTVGFNYTYTADFRLSTSLFMTNISCLRNAKLFTSDSNIFYIHSAVNTGGIQQSPDFDTP